LYFMLCFPLATWARKYEERLKLNDIARIPFDKREVAVP